MGPLTLAEMKEAHKKMQFGLSDEVTGHCGPWISFDNIEGIKKHYPDIARVVHEDMLAGWGVSDHTGARLVGDGDTKKIMVKGPRSLSMALTFLVIALLAFAAAVYLASANANKLSGKLNEPGREPTPQDAQGYIDRGEIEAFDEFMSVNGEGIVQRMTKQKKNEALWLPYLRYHAFLHEGSFANVPPRTLRGQAAPSAPSDCSLKQWRKRWRESMKQWNAMLQEKRLVRAHWARMLAWDPHWIRRRDNKGWIGSQNYYTGCLSMADRAFTELLSDSGLVASPAEWEKLGYGKVRQRLSFVLEMARDGRVQSPMPPFDATNPLNVWTCIEGAREMRELARCREGQVAPPLAQDPDGIFAYTEERVAWNALRIAAGLSGTLPADLLQAINSLAPKAQKTDFYTRFDYRAEQKLIKILAKPAPGDRQIEKVVEKVYAEFPELRPAH